MSVQSSRISKVVLGALFVTLLQVVPSADWLTTANAGYPNPGPNSSTSTIPAGAYIIDAGAIPAGATKQTIGTGLRTYGLVYALVKSKIPVQWVINPDKSAIDQNNGNTGVDIRGYDCDGSGTRYAAKDYKTGAFVIAKEFAAQAAGVIATFKAISGNGDVVVDGPCTQELPNLPVFATIKSWPRVALDAQNGAVAVTYFQNAGIPDYMPGESASNPLTPPSYRFVAPSALTACDDVYAMPHADPTYATHSNLINFVKQGGDFYASCHAVSVVENMTATSGGDKVMNFLSTNGLINYDAHVQGTPPYSIYDTSTVAEFTYPSASYVSNHIGGADVSAPTTLTGSYSLPGLDAGDPIAQFLGRTDAAQQQGSEQIFMPAANSRWRPTTQIVMYNSAQKNLSTNGGTSPGLASSVLYGPAFGNSNYGQVMYVGGHSSAKGTVDDVAAQRLFFNFLLLASVNSSGATAQATDRTPTVTMKDLGTNSVAPGTSIAVEGSAKGGSGVYRYQWTAACYDRSGHSIATSPSNFSPSASLASATFTPPTLSGDIVSNCSLTLTAIDSCGRFSFGFENLAISPTTDVLIGQTLSGGTRVGQTLTSVLTVTNTSGGVAADALVTAVAPSNATIDASSGFTITGAPSGANCSATTSGKLSCDLKDLPIGAVVTITWTLTVTGAGSLTVTSNVSTVSGETDYSNNSDSDSINVLAADPIAQVSILKEPSDQQVRPGDTAAFKLTVKNTSTGDFTLNNIGLFDTSTVGGTMVCQEGSNTVLNGVNGYYVIPTLARGATWTAWCNISGVTTSGYNYFSVDSYTVNTDPSPTVPATPIRSQAHVIVNAETLTFTKTKIAGTVTPGNTVTYKVEVTNNTSTQKKGIQFSDVFAPGSGLSLVPSSANVYAKSTGSVSSKTGRLILMEKFSSSSVSNSGDWSTADSDSTSKVGKSLGGKSISAAVFGGTSDSSSMSASKSYSIKKSITFNSTDASASINFSCQSINGNSGSSATQPLVSLLLGDSTLVSNKACSTSSMERVSANPSSTIVGTGSKVLKIVVTCPRTVGCSKWAVVVDDISVVTGLVLNDGFDGTFDASQAIGTGKAFIKAVATPAVSNGDSSKGGSNAIIWSSNTGNNLQSSSTANYVYSLSLPAASYGSSATLRFNYSIEKDGNGTNDYLKVALGADCLATPLDTFASSGSTVGSYYDSSSNSTKTYTFTPAGDMKLCFIFHGQKRITVDDVMVIASPAFSVDTKCPADINPEDAFTGACLATSVTGDAAKAAAILDQWKLDPGQSMYITFDVLIERPFPDPNATAVINLASIKYQGQTTPTHAIVGNPWATNPLSIVKTVDSATVVGTERPTFRYVLKNAGDVQLDTITVTDENGCALSAPASLAAGASSTFTCSPITADVVKSVTLGVVTASGTDNSDPTAPNTYYAYSSKYITQVVPDLALDPVTPATTSITSGSKVAYTYKVRNPGTIGMSGVHVRAQNCANVSYFSGDSDSDQVLDTSETWTFKCLTSAINSTQIDETVTATAENIYNGAVITTAERKVSVNVVTQPTLTITKTVHDGSYGSDETATVGVSNHIYYRLTVTVTNGPVSSIVVGDDGCSFNSTATSGDSTNPGILDDRETWTFDCDGGVAYASSSNSATVYGKMGGASGATVTSNSVTTWVQLINPDLLLSIDPLKQYLVAGSSNTYTYTVQNVGGIAINDFIGHDANCTSTPNLSFGNLAVGEKKTQTCSYTINTDTKSDFYGAGEYVAGGSTVSYTPDTATVQVFAINPVFHLVKKATVYVGSSTTETRTATSQAVSAEVGDRIVFNYELSAETGTGASRIDGLNSIFKTSYTDADCAASPEATLVDGYNSGDSNQNGYIDPGETWFYTCEAKSSLTDGVTPHALRVATTPLAKIRNGGLFNAPVGAALTAATRYSSMANATSTLNSGATFNAFSSLDDPGATSPIVTLSGTSSVVITLNGATLPSTPVTPITPTLLTPKITWPNPAQQVGPWTLSPGQLNASCSVPGSTLTYSPKLGEVLQPGTYVLTVTCTPPAGSGYGPLTTTVPFTVVKPEAKITWPTPSPVTGPAVLGPTQLNAQCSIPGATLTYDPARYAKLNPGTYTLKVTCTPPAGSIFAPVSTTVQFVVNPPGKIVLDPPSAPVMKLVSGTSSTIAWVKSPNATGYYVTLSDKRVCITSAVKCTIKKLVGPNSDVKIYATKGSLTSTYVVPTLKQSAKPQVIGMVYFDSAKFNIKSDQKAEIKRVAGLLKQLGYTDVIIGGHTDSNAYDNLTLSNNRALSTQDALSKLVPGLNVDLHYSGATEPMASNTTLTGQAKNRRAEIAVW